MGGKESSSGQKKIEIICPKCPLTPIISISINAEGILTCEYRCPFMHFGVIPFEDIDKDKENKHGKFCDRCAKAKKEEDANKNIIEEDSLLYCGTCKQFICKKCRPEHDAEKESHKTLVPKDKISYTCLEHGKNYIGFCFTCLISVCPDCKRHEKHCKKQFEEFYPDKDFIDNYKYYIKDYGNYIKSVSRSAGMNKNHFNRFKDRNQLLLGLSNYLYNNYEDKKSKKQLNGEMLINLLNVVNFNFKADQLTSNEAFVTYCKTHLLLSNKPISDICTFSKTKSDYNISKFVLEEYSAFGNAGTPNEFKYYKTGELIIYNIGSCIHFLSTQGGQDSEKVGSKIRLDEAISSFSIINHNILCVCSKKIHLYELTNKAPFYSEYYKTEDLNIFDEPVVEVFGNMDKDLLVRTTKELLLVNEDKKNKGKYIITERIYLEDVNTKVVEKKVIPNKTNNYYDYDYGYGYNNNKTKTITITKDKITKIKAIYNDNIILVEGGVITTRELNTLRSIKTLNEYKNIDCLVFNGNIIVPNGNDIYFYTIPDLDRVSQITVSDKIVSLSLVNKKTLIVVEEKYLEQFETNTWKRLWRQISLGENIQNNQFNVIGAGNKLFLYEKEKKIFYQLVLPKNDNKKKK